MSFSNADLNRRLLIEIEGGDAVEGTHKLSAQSIQPAWKQEVNQRLAAHKNRNGTTDACSQKTQASQPGASRAGEAAARVAARYAKAPSYSQMQAEEARAAVRAAEIATQVAIEAQAAAESALAELHAAAEKPIRGPAVVESITRAPRVEEPAPETETPPSIDDLRSVASEFETAAAPDQPAVFTREMVDGKSFNLRWEPDLPARALHIPIAPELQQEHFELATEDWWTPAQLNATLHSEPIAVDALPGHANLIEFPRELVAARRLRPRLAEAAGQPDHDAQLSIFEVDPGTVSFEPMPETSSQPLAAAGCGATWSGMELDAQPDRVATRQSEAAVKRGPYLAPLGLRLLALAVDLSLILAVFSTAVLGVISKGVHLPAPKAAEALAIFGLLLTGFAYHALFFAFSNMTPGMRYAGVALCTFDNEVPSREQLRRRLGAMAVSLLPVGLGIVWSVFDDDHLSWHDRISGTYLRSRRGPPGKSATR